MRNVRKVFYKFQTLFERVPKLFAAFAGQYHAGAGTGWLERRHDEELFQVCDLWCWRPSTGWCFDESQLKLSYLVFCSSPPSTSRSTRQMISVLSDDISTYQCEVRLLTLSLLLERKGSPRATLHFAFRMSFRTLGWIRARPLGVRVLLVLCSWIAIRLS